MLGAGPETFPPAIIYWSMLVASGSLAFLLVVLVSLIHRNEKERPKPGHFGPIIRPVSSRVPGGRQER